ncbi:hypothetical protein KSP39_PZI004508 [Platanthera zijinensis]|uniref:Uncharacterized protein n=1 Tax=Platanthera zijinensis TaxID=2320716 RepID=A0AAP0GDI4_9ASPA
MKTCRRRRRVAGLLSSMSQEAEESWKPSGSSFRSNERAAHSSGGSRRCRRRRRREKRPSSRRRRRREKRPSGLSQKARSRRGIKGRSHRREQGEMRPSSPSRALSRKGGSGKEEQVVGNLFADGLFLFQVGKVSMEWLAGDRTKIAGTFPPRKRGWTGYVEKDTAGQTNIYSIEPSVYVAENAISSGNAGTSSEGAENTVAIAGGLALISLAAASSVLIQVYKNEPQIQRADNSGPPLSYYINKFKPNVPAEASAPPAPELSPSAEATEPPESSFSSELQPKGDANAVFEVQVDVDTPDVSSVS